MFEAFHTDLDDAPQVFHIERPDAPQLVHIGKPDDVLQTFRAEAPEALQVVHTNVRWILLPVGAAVRAVPQISHAVLLLFPEKDSNQAGLLLSGSRHHNAVNSQRLLVALHLHNHRSDGSVCRERSRKARGDHTGCIAFEVPYTF